MSQTPYGARLKAARERAELTVRQVIDALGFSFGEYEDLEWFDDLYTATRITVVLSVCRQLGITTNDIFAEPPGTDNCVRHYTFNEVADLLRRKLEESGEPLAAFEDRIGWGLRQFLNDPKCAWDWNIECLADVCTALDLDWRCVLPVQPPAPA